MDDATFLFPATRDDLLRPLSEEESSGGGGLMNDVRRVVLIERAGPIVEDRFDFVVRGEACALTEETRGMKRPDVVEFPTPSTSLPLLELNDELPRSFSGARDGLKREEEEVEAWLTSPSRAKVNG